MNIGEEEEAIEVPIPLMPGETQQPDPQTAPEEVPARELEPAAPAQSSVVMSSGVQS